MISQRKWPLIAIIYVVVALLFLGIIGARKTISVEVDGSVLVGRAYGGTVGSYLAREKVEIGEYDQVTPEVDAYLVDDLAIMVRRAVPVVVTVDGETNEWWVIAGTVEEALDEMEIVLEEEDIVEPDLDEPIKEKMHIQIIRVTKEIHVEEETVAYSTIRRDDASMEYGTEKVIQEGQAGVLQKTYLKFYEDGEKVSKDLLDKREIKPARDRIIVRGTAGTITRQGRTVRYTRVMNMEATGYWPDPAWSDGYTATGMKATKGIVAVDPSVISLGSRVYVDGYGFAIAADVGGNIIGRRIDLCFDNFDDAMAVGRRTVTVYILD